MSFLEVFLDGSVVVRCHGGIFLYVMVGRDSGVSGPKELMGWDDTVTDGRAYRPPSPCSTDQ
jgi:hypothetical protein